MHFLGVYQLTARNSTFSLSQIFDWSGGSTVHRRTLAHAMLLGLLWEILSMFFHISFRCSHVFNQYSLRFGAWQLLTSKPSAIFLSYHLTLTKLI
jgi:hypothetical protein